MMMMSIQSIWESKTMMKEEAYAFSAEMMSWGCSLISRHHSLSWQSCYVRH